MGGGESKEETKTIDTTGNVNNNVVIQESVPIHNEEMKILLYVICVVKIIQFIFFIYKFQVRRLKKKYNCSRIDIQKV